jgi:hypothetical protein
MTELQNIIQIFGAVDDVVVAEPDLLPKVAALLPAYDGGAAGWYEAMNNWYGSLEKARRRASAPAPTDPQPARKSKTAAVRKKAQPVKKQAPPPAPSAGAPEPPPLTDALTDLAEIPADADDSWSARRLLSIAVLSRVLSPTDAIPGDPLGPVGTDDLAQALVPLIQGAQPTGRRGRSSEIARAQALLTRLSDEETYPNLASWPALLQDAQHAGLISPALATKQMAPCVWEVVHTPHSHGPSVAFATHHRFEGVSFNSVTPILDPANWMTYSPPWCGMRSLGSVLDRTFGATGTSTRYLEEVANACGNGGAVYKFTTSLDFLSVDVSENDAQVLEYRRSHDQRADGGDGSVTVDEGSLVVYQVGTAVDVVTTKRVQFRALRRMPGPVAAMVAQFVWALGYSSLAELFVNKITAATAGAKVKTLHPLQGGSLSGGAPPSSGGDLTTVLTATMQDCRKGVRSSLGKMAAGGYGAKDYAADVAKVSNHGRRQSAALASLWANVLFGDQPVSGANASPEPEPAPRPAPGRGR